jgi:sec-independent protein translocase protein TatC
MLVPLLFATGVVFGYLVVLEPAIRFLLNFNESEFATQVRARDYYSFVALTLLSLGILFQVPFGILVVTRLGIVTPRQLRQRRREAYVVAAVLAALLPTIDPVTMLLETIPLIVLFELSILLASVFGRPREEPVKATPAPEGRG